MEGLRNMPGKWPFGGNTDRPPEFSMEFCHFQGARGDITPTAHWHPVRGLVQLERITFRAVRVFLRTALLSALNLILSL